MRTTVAALASLGALLLPATLLAQQPTQSRPKPAETTEHQITEPPLRNASPPIIEFRLAESEPADGLIAANVVGRDTTVYLHQTVVATNKDIERARAGLGSDWNLTLHLWFTKEGAAKMATLTEANLGKFVAILIDGKVVVAPRLDSKITDVAQVDMEDLTEAEVERIAKAIRGESVGLPSDAASGHVRSDTGSPESTTRASTARDERLRRLQLAARQEPRAVRPRTLLGDLHFDQERWAEAATWYRASLEIEPRNAAVLTDLGVCYYHLGQPDQALEAFDRALSVDPDATRTLLNKGIVLAFGKNDLAGAKTAWERVVSLAPGTAEGDVAEQALENMWKASSKARATSEGPLQSSAAPSGPEPRFDETLTGWDTTAVRTEHIRTAGGALRLTGDSGWLLTSASCGEFSLKFEARALTSDTAAGMLLRVQTGSPRSAYELSLCRGGQCGELLQHEGGETRRVRLPTVIRPSDSWRRYFVDVRGHNIAAFVDDEPVLKGGALAYDDGRLGFSVSQGAIEIRGFALQCPPSTIPPPTKIRDVAPVYPEDAREVGLEGVVIIEAWVLATGLVGSAEVRSGPGPLRAEALKAVRQWRYTPTLVNGMPVPVIMTVTVNFLLPPLMLFELKNLLLGLRDGDEEIREAAARACGIYAPTAADAAKGEVVSALKKATEDESERVRKAATEALARIQS